MYHKLLRTVTFDVTGLLRSFRPQNMRFTLLYSMMSYGCRTLVLRLILVPGVMSYGVPYLVSYAPTELGRRAFGSKQNKNKSSVGLSHGYYNMRIRRSHATGN